MIRKSLSMALAAAILVTSVPVAFAQSPASPIDKKFGASVERRDSIEHEKVRRQQVRQNSGHSLFEPIFHPLYKGKNAPTQQVKRAFN
ncbi:hypothetical protein [Bosea sp. 117]|uniref:hypothetical protein n=1 Tax=Bosea sp. 117 TaxID=1125973 RepID=UPI0004943DB7|nr:hypothetical protein [Bosea sp. 117]